MTNRDQSITAQALVKSIIESVPVEGWADAAERAVGLYRMVYDRLGDDFANSSQGSGPGGATASPASTPGAYLVKGSNANKNGDGWRLLLAGDHPELGDSGTWIGVSPWERSLDVARTLQAGDQVACKIQRSKCGRYLNASQVARA